MASGGRGATARRTVTSWGLTLLGALVLMFVLGIARAPSLPEIAPTFSAPSVDGTPFDLAQLRGQPVVLNFWATWCGPCRFEVPALSRFAKRHPEIAVIGVVSPEPIAQIAAAIDDLAVDYPVVRGTPKVLSLYGVTTFPTTVFIDAEGRVRTAHVGAMLDPQLELAALSL